MLSNGVRMRLGRDLPPTPRLSRLSHCHKVTTRINIGFSYDFTVTSKGHILSRSHFGLEPGPSALPIPFPRRPGNRSVTVTTRMNVGFSRDSKVTPKGYILSRSQSGLQKTGEGIAEIRQSIAFDGLGADSQAA